MKDARQATEAGFGAGGGVRRRFAKRALLSLAAGGCGVLIGAGAAYAFWADGVSVAGGPVVAGDLRLGTGTPSWEQITPGLENPAHGDLDGLPADFTTMPGDIIKITEPITTFLRGDNIAGGLVVDYSDPSKVTGQIESTFHIESTSGRVVGPEDGEADFGELVVVPGLVGDDDGETAEWNVVVTVRVLGDYDWTDQPSGSDPATWAAGTIDVALKQVREGQGFTGGNE